MWMVVCSLQLSQTLYIQVRWGCILMSKPEITKGALLNSAGRQPVIPLGPQSILPVCPICQHTLLSDHSACQKWAHTFLGVHHPDRCDGKGWCWFDFSSDLLEVAANILHRHTVCRRGTVQSTIWFMQQQVTYREIPLVEGSFVSAQQ